MRYHLTGLSICSTAGQIETYDQLGGQGRVWNKALAIAGHLGDPWASIEYVSIDPIREGAISAVGKHRQQTDEIYYILSGTGTLTTNGRDDVLSTGWLSFAPRGTIHTICNTSPTEALTFLVVELQAKEASPLPALINLAARMEPGASIAPVRVAGKIIHPQTATINLQEIFAGAWGAFSVLELPPGAHIEEYCEEETDQLLLLSGFTSAFVTKCCPTIPGEKREEIAVLAMGEDYQCLLVPPGVPCRLENRASGNYPAFLFRLTVPRKMGNAAHA
jgi:mannose-6-phosphate isomerase-like protein (cupin superfamily)